MSEQLLARALNVGPCLDGITSSLYQATVDLSLVNALEVAGVAGLRPGATLDEQMMSTVVAFRAACLAAYAAERGSGAPRDHAELAAELAFATNHFNPEQLRKYLAEHEVWRTRPQAAVDALVAHQVEELMTIG